MSFNHIVKILSFARSCGLKEKSSSLRLHVPLLKNVAMSNAGNLQKNFFSKTKVFQFQVTPPKQALPPLVMLLFRFVGKAGAVISGRMIRKWWQKLSPEDKRKVIAKIQSKKSHIAFIGSIFTGGLLLYYFEHVVEDPVTKRKRFIMLNLKQINQIAEFEYQHQLQQFSSEIVPAYHPMYRRVLRVANNLLLSNTDIKEIKSKAWSVTVVDRPDIVNAFALPHGKIFVFTGMLNICTNDDQLAIVLAHEISHSILSHVAESMSKIFFVEFILLIPSLIFWSIFPDIWALFSEWVTSSLTKIFIHLPFSRAIEKEADVVGLQLAAKSCYDVREAPVFWGKMKVVSTDMPLEWLSTHPRHETRQIELQELIPKALEIRELSQCPPLRVKVKYW